MTVSVTETLKCSLEVTQGHWKWQIIYDLNLLLVHHFRYFSSRTIVELFDVENIMTFKSWLQFIQGH